MSCDLSALVLGIMAVPRNQPKLVFRPCRVIRTGRRKLFAWSEHGPRGIPACCRLEKHEKRPGQYVWTDLLVTQRISPRYVALQRTDRCGLPAWRFLVFLPVRLSVGQSLCFCWLETFLDSPSIWRGRRICGLWWGYGCASKAQKATPSSHSDRRS